MIVDLENAPTFFEWEDGTEGGIEIRLVNPEKLDEIDKKTSKVKKVIKRGVRTEEKKVNSVLRDKLTWDYCIVSWTGIKDKDGNDVECNIDNKYLLMRKSNAFAMFVNDCMSELLEQLNIEQEELEKN